MRHGAEHSMDKHNSTDTSATAQRAVASGPLVRPDWKWAMHLNGPRMVTQYRDNKLGVSCERWCFRRGPVDCAEYYGGGTAFFIDGDEREFATEADMLTALAARPNTHDDRRGR